MIQFANHVFFIRVSTDSMGKPDYNGTRFSAGEKRIRRSVKLWKDKQCQDRSCGEVQ